MLKTIKLISIATVAAAIITSCDKLSSFKKDESGVEYKMYKDEEGKKAEKGDFLTLHFKYTAKVKGTDRDTVLRNTWEEGKPIYVLVGEPTFKGGIEDALKLLSEGDSVDFRFPIDSIFSKTFIAPVPDFMDSTGSVIFTIKVLKVQNKEDFEKDQAKLMEESRAQQQEQMAKQKEIDEKLIQEYITANNLKVQRTPSGLAYIITKAGKGPKPTSGQIVSVKYEGKLLNGTKFDESGDRGPLEFTIGVGQVIPGWDEGISLLNQGSKATLIIPSGLAYGPMAMGPDLPANSILVFDVELVKIQTK
jgi:FKBP-type peptidyl-prolyl cis-trans isomerase